VKLTRDRSLDESQRLHRLIPTLRSLWSLVLVRHRPIVRRMDSDDLVERCRSGDREALRQLYQRHVNPIYRLVLRMTGNPQDAFDLTQDTFVTAFQNMGSFDCRARIGTWLYRIATNHSLQLFRRRRTEQKHLRAHSELAAQSTALPTAALRAEVDDALARMSEEQRAILLLKYYEGLSYEEIAEVLECPPGTVASRLNRARDQLRRLLKGDSHRPGRIAADSASKRVE
jgi:RNA polymerase sigma-70 factor (ECF subfamily)